MNFTRNGLRLGSSIENTTHRRVEEFGYSCHQRRLTWAKRRRTGLLPSGPKSSFQMRASSVFHLETKVLESGGRVEKLHCVFLKTNVTAPVYQYILEHFMLPSADQLFKDADFIFQQDLAPAHTARSTKRWLNEHGVGVLDWPANSPDLNIENLWSIVKRNKRPKNADEGHCQRNLGFTPPQQYKLITSMPRRIEAVIKAKAASTKY